MALQWVTGAIGAFLQFVYLHFFFVPEKDLWILSCFLFPLDLWRCHRLKSLGRNLPHYYLQHCLIDSLFTQVPTTDLEPDSDWFNYCKPSILFLVLFLLQIGLGTSPILDASRFLNNSKDHVTFSSRRFYIEEIKAFLIISSLSDPHSQEKAQIITLPPPCLTVHMSY